MFELQFANRRKASASVVVQQAYLHPAAITRLQQTCWPSLANRQAPTVHEATAEYDEHVGRIMFELCLTEKTKTCELCAEINVMYLTKLKSYCTRLKG